MGNRFVTGCHSFGMIIVVIGWADLVTTDRSSLMLVMVMVVIIHSEMHIAG